MSKPKYNTARGEAELSEDFRPPFDFQDVSVRVFPLWAAIAPLKGLCDSYLNFVPRELAQFRPAVPYVYLAVLYYGKMQSRKAGHRGWVSQNEVAFIVPLQWLREEAGRTVFVDWAWFIPYIFVDDDISLMTGREVYGWPKLPAQIQSARIESEGGLWELSPPSRSRLAVRAAGFPPAETRAREKYEVLLEIDHESSLTPSPFAPEILNAFLNPLLSVTQTVQQSVSALGDWAGVWPSLVLAGSQRAVDPQALSHITLKQFRDADEPQYVCYQALVNSRLGINKYRNGGLLGGGNLWRGDATGGFQINLRRPLATPILEALGLEVAEERKENGYAVATLKPFYPFWAEADLEYGRASTVCWCTKEFVWHRGSTVDHPLTTHQEKNTRKEGTRPEAVEYEPVSRVSMKEQDRTRPQRPLDVTLEVYPLEADGDKLQQFCNAYLNDLDLPEGMRFVLLVPSVYLTVLSYQNGDGGAWEPRELAFSIPVQWYEKDEQGNESLVDWALVSPFVFAETDVDAIIDRELNGRPTMDAMLKREGRGSGSGPGYGRLTLETEVLSDLDPTQPATNRLLLEIDQGNAHPAKKERLPGKIFTDGIKSVMLKQFRDADEPDRACYQAIVQFRWVVEHRSEVKDLTDSAIRIRQYPYFPIVELLGLTYTLGGDSAVAELRPVGSVSMQVKMREGEARETVCWRAGTEEWVRLGAAKGKLTGLSNPGALRRLEKSLDSRQVALAFFSEV